MSVVPDIPNNAPRSTMGMPGRLFSKNSSSPATSFVKKKKKDDEVLHDTKSTITTITCRAINGYTRVREKKKKKRGGEKVNGSHWPHLREGGTTRSFLEGGSVEARVVCPPSFGRIGRRGVSPSFIFPPSPLLLLPFYACGGMAPAEASANFSGSNTSARNTKRESDREETFFFSPNSRTVRL